MNIKSIKKISRLMFLVITIIFSATYLLGCGDKKIEKMSEQPKKTEIIVSAAASLSESYTEIAKKIKEEKNIDVVLNFAGSQSLVTSIEAGAKVDVFASANVKYIDRLNEKGMLAKDKIFAKNILVACKNIKSKVEIKSLKDLGNSEVKLIVGDKTVPVGSYFYTALDNSIIENNLTEEERYRIIGNVKSNELSVKDVVSKVLLGEGDVGIVYKTDVNDANRHALEIIEFEEFKKLKTEYYLGIVSTSTKKELAEVFVDYTTNGYGKEILKKHGFIVE